MTTPAGWTWAVLAIVAPTLIAAHDPPSVTFYNQIMAVFGWGGLLAWLGMQKAAPAFAKGVKAQSGAWALTGLLSLHAMAALWSGVYSTLPIGLSLMGAGLSLAALLALWSGWRQARSHTGDAANELFFGSLALAGTIGMVIALVQVFAPSLTDGDFLARTNMAGRAVGNLRQPNHFSTLLVFSIAGFGWLGTRYRLPPKWAAAMIAVCIGGVVLTASRTGMVAMLLLSLWGIFDRRLPRVLRLTLATAPLVYAAWWGAMWALTHLTQSVSFASEARLNDGSDISSSRFQIWANVLTLIKQHPWWGVGYGEFNLAWTLSVFPDRPTAFFDHTHNLILQWAVELGLPLATLLTLLALWGFWCLIRPGFLKEQDVGDSAAVGASAVIVAMAGLHSLLEYPLWYSYFLLPTAFAWGIGLGSREISTDKVTEPNRFRLWLGSGVIMALMAVWCAVDYQAAANIYAPRPGSGNLEQRIALSKPMPWWGYQADYADVTTKNKAANDEPVPPEAFKRTLHNLLDARLMMAYATSLAEHGQVDQARFVAARLREFRNASAKPFFEVCDTDKATTELPFQCEAPEHHYHWRELLP